MFHNQLEPLLKIQNIYSLYSVENPCCAGEKEASQKTPIVLDKSATKPQES